MKKVIVVTGASSGFGALAARALAKAGHVVYASMRDTSGRNKGQVQEAAKFAADNERTCARSNLMFYRIRQRLQR
jgi:NAD(P)-dependent dehydrogenase (short-subunit alcohol dehydrogenase family)